MSPEHARLPGSPHRLGLRRGRLLGARARRLRRVEGQVDGNRSRDGRPMMIGITR